MTKLLPSRRSVAERNKLVEDNYRLVYWAYNRALVMYPNLRRWFPDRSEDDWYQVLAEGLIRAAELYDENYLVNGKPVRFATYACLTLIRVVTRDIDKFMRRLNNKEVSIPFTDLLGSRSVVGHPADGVDYSRLEERLGLIAKRSDSTCYRDEVDLINDLARRILSERDLNILISRMAGETLTSLAQQYKISKEGIRQCLHRSLDRLRQAHRAKEISRKKSQKVVRGQLCFHEASHGRVV